MRPRWKEQIFQTMCFPCNSVNPGFTGWRCLFILLFLPITKVEFRLIYCVMFQYNLRKPDAIFLNRKHDILPFEDVTPIEKLCHKYDTSLFVFSSHNKKRPNNIVIGTSIHFIFYFVIIIIIKCTNFIIFSSVYYT